jgi:hypothetical protein
MKFEIGDETDKALCVVLKHEFLRCDDAFNEFAASARVMIMQGENRRIAYKTYNAYARFVHYLYEFMLAAIAKDRNDTNQLSAEWKDKYMASHFQRVLTNRREAILNGTAPAWENHISAFPEKIPRDLAKEFRRVRNVAGGHAVPARSGLNLSDFYDRNHMYLHMLYQESRGWWGRQTDEFPDLDEITSFSVLIRDEAPPPANLQEGQAGESA